MYSLVLAPAIPCPSLESECEKQLHQNFYNTYPILKARLKVCVLTGLPPGPCCFCPCVPPEHLRYTRLVLSTKVYHLNSQIYHLSTKAYHLCQAYQ